LQKILASATKIFVARKKLGKGEKLEGGKLGQTGKAGTVTHVLSRELIM
jgi:hypothetical protein